MIDIKEEREHSSVFDNDMLNLKGRIICQEDLYDIFPFGKTKTKQLIQSGELPLVKIGRDYITTFELIQDWISKHIGEEIYI